MQNYLSSVQGQSFVPKERISNRILQKTNTSRTISTDNSAVYDLSATNYAIGGLNFKGTGSIIQNPDVNSEKIKEQLAVNLHKTVKGLDRENFWVMKDLKTLINGLDNERAKELLDLTNNAIDKKIQIPYAKDAEYVEMPLPMADGKMYATKMFPGYFEGKLTMRTFLDKDIPNDKYMTYRDASLCNPKMHPGETWCFEPYMNPGMDKFNSDDVFERLKSRFNVAHRIHYFWTGSPDTAEKFTRWYDDATFIHNRYLDRSLSPLHPDWQQR